MKDMKVRLEDDSMVEDVDLWLASGTVRVSRNALITALFKAFHSEIVGKEPTLDIIAECISASIKTGRVRVDNLRFGAANG